MVLVVVVVVLVVLGIATAVLVVHLVLLATAVQDKLRGISLWARYVIVRILV